MSLWYTYFYCQQNPDRTHAGHSPEILTKKSLQAAKHRNSCFRRFWRNLTKCNSCFPGIRRNLTKKPLRVTILIWSDSAGLSPNEYRESRCRLVAPNSNSAKARNCDSRESDQISIATRDGFLVRFERNPAKQELHLVIIRRHRRALTRILRERPPDTHQNSEGASAGHSPES